MKNLINLLQQHLNEKGNRTVPHGYCTVQCSDDLIPSQPILTTFGMQEHDGSSYKKVGDYYWGGGVFFTDLPFYERTLLGEDKKPVILTYKNIKYQVKIVVLARRNVLGGRMNDFWAVFEAVDENDSDRSHNVFSVIQRLKSDYICELEERLEKLAVEETPIILN